ncbi:glycerol kinase GlpK [Mucilaginibacter gotjawali]|uniref:Glycerol kinase n=2 Tax=Mucilaginibacter gotjawali TaxID=1550579 RepID=A0A0X8X7Q3_9SPHI|nr:glycerol kinase GlpK [Mucilaginibacter gotjawali]MBB3056280.1 glycerol kinase [Mucilaginibacter gotjawali]BAU54984.1 Glycerol kinase [Mucilaginibacter gotjawali]
MEEKYILALDQGTTSSRAIIFDHQGQIMSVAQKEFTQIFPQPGWVEHDPNEIWSSQAGVAAEVTAKFGINGTNISAIGITNQRETTIVWNRETGLPVYNAIVWQDRRTATFCDHLKNEGLTEPIRSKTGLIIDAYFSASKINWILNHVEGAKELAAAGKLAFGTVDSWLVWKFTRGKVHVTDVTNASRTMLYNIKTLEWDEELLQIFGVPRSMLPEVKQSSEVYGETATTIFASKIPIAGIAGDQQAALFGQMCIDKAMVKNTYGTGCFMLMNIGEQFIASKNNLLTTIAWRINGKTEYAFEGSIFIGGAVVQWLRDGLGIIRSSAEVEDLAMQVEDTGGVYFVPAFAGLGAPYWDSEARGTIVGLTRGSTSAHISRAAIESIAFQTVDVLKAMEADAGLKIKELRVDGGATANNLLMQFQADLLNCKVIRPKIVETTALGAAYLAGLAVGYWKNVEEIRQQWQSERDFIPGADPADVEKAMAGWKRAVSAARSF